MTTAEKHYAHYLGVTQYIELRLACAIVKGTFSDSFGLYLVGSALTRKDWRDVDVRHIISDEEFERRFGEFIEPYERNHFLRAFNLGVSAWMSAAAKLPIDYRCSRSLRRMSFIRTRTIRATALGCSE